MRLSIKLGALCAVVALIPSVIISLVALSNYSSRLYVQAASSLEKDARAAVSLYEKRLVEMGAAAQRLAERIANRALVTAESQDPAAQGRLQDLLTHAQNDFSLDFITVANPQAKIIAQRPVLDQSLLGAEDKSPLAEKIVSGADKAVASAAIERGDRCARLGLDRIVRAAGDAAIDEALMIEAGAPIFSGGRMVGTVTIGQMLNVYYNPRPRSANELLAALQTPLIAEIRQTLYQNATEGAGALVASGNIIIASSIQASSARADSAPPLVGASRDPAKSQETLSHGERSYIVAWQPIKSLDGSDVGAIGVARPASEVVGPAATLRTLLIIVVAIVTLGAGGAGFLYGYSLATRVNDLSEAANRWSVGELSMVARDRDPMVPKWIPGFIARDEVSRLAEHLEQMRESFRQAIERLRKR